MCHRERGIVLQLAHNEVERRNDPTAHAEMVVASRDLCAKLGVADLKGCTLYCTLQPCGMCSLACVWAGISRIVHGATRATVNSVYFEMRHAIQPTSYEIVFVTIWRFGAEF